MDFWSYHSKIPEVLKIVGGNSLKPSILLIRGEIRSGKRMLGDWLQAQSFSGSIFWVRPKVVYGNNTMLDSLVEGFSSTDLKARKTCQAFKKAWSDLKNSESYNEKAHFDDWLKTLESTVFSQLERKNPSKLIFFLDDYSKWSLNGKDWFSNFVKVFLAQKNLNYQVNFIVTGEKSLQNSLEFEDYWKTCKDSLVEIDWHSFTEEELEKIFQKAKIPKDLVKDLYRETKGLPGPVFRKLDLLLDSSQKWIFEQKVDGKLEGLSTLEKNTILFLAHNGYLDSESVYCLLKEESSQKLIKSINFDKPFSLKQKKYPLSLKSEDRKAILSWHEHEKAGEFLDYKKRVDAYQRFQKQIPDRDVRDALRVLALFENFHKALLLSVFGDKGMGLWFLVKSQPTLFVPTHNGYKVTDALREDIKTSGLGINADRLSSIKKKAHTYWLTYKKEIEKDHLTLQKEIKYLKDQNTKNQHDLKKICKRTNDYQKKFVKNFRGNYRNTGEQFITVEFVKNSFVLPFILALVGFLFLYLSLLYKDIALVSLIAGLGSLVTGFLISYKAGTRKIKKQKKMTREEIANALRDDSFNKLLGLHKDALTNKHAGLNKKLRNLGNNLRNLEMIIKHSFIKE